MGALNWSTFSKTTVGDLFGSEIINCYKIFHLQTKLHSKFCPIVSHYPFGLTCLLFCWCQSDVLPKHPQLVDLHWIKRHLNSKSKEIHHPQILLPNLHRWTHELNQTSKPGTGIDRNVCSLNFQLEKDRNWRWLEHFSIPLGAFCPETIRNEISARGSLRSIMIYDARNLWQIARLRIVLNQSLLHVNISSGNDILLTVWSPDHDSGKELAKKTSI